MPKIVDSAMLPPCGDHPDAKGHRKHDVRGEGRGRDEREIRQFLKRGSGQQPEKQCGQSQIDDKEVHPAQSGFGDLFDFAGRVA